MAEMKLALVESRFADIIWREEPIKSRDLANVCERELEWKRTTTYTVLKKLCERGLFQNQDGVVTSKVSKEEFYGMQGEKLVDEAFNGSLPAFIAAFTKRKALTPEEIDEIRRMIGTDKEV